MGGWYTEAEAEALNGVLGAMPGWARCYSREHQETFEAAFAAYVGARHAVSLNSGGVALDLALRALNANDGDEVISCAINFPGTHLAVIGRRLRLVLAEPDPDSLNLDPAEISKRMTRRTKAVLVTHMNGLPADLDAITSATETQAATLGIQGPRIIVDAARACGAETPTGRVGDGGQAWITMFSFHRKKLMTTLGEGGMLTTNDDEAAAALRRLRSYGHGDGWGSSYRMTEHQAAVGTVQLARLEEMLTPRIALAHARTARLDGTAGIALPAAPSGVRHVYYLYNVILDTAWPPGARDRIRTHLQGAGIGTVIANPPTYRSNRLIAAETAGQGRFEVAESVADRLLCPALHPLMTGAENTRIAVALGDAVAQLAGT